MWVREETLVVAQQVGWYSLASKSGVLRYVVYLGQSNRPQKSGRIHWSLLLLGSESVVAREGRKRRRKRAVAKRKRRQCPPTTLVVDCW